MKYKTIHNNNGKLHLLNGEDKPLCNHQNKFLIYDSKRELEIDSDGTLYEVNPQISFRLKIYTESDTNFCKKCINKALILFFRNLKSGAIMNNH